MGNSASAPSAPNPAKTYVQGLQSNIKLAPDVASAEYELRDQYDATSVENNLTRQAGFGNQFINYYRQQLAQGDPWGVKVQQQAGQAVSDNLALGYQLTGDQARQAQQQARAQEVASGNMLGNASVSAEATAIGKTSFAAFQKRVEGAQSFTQANNALRMVKATQGLTTGATSPDRGFSYLSPQAGFNAQGLADQTYDQAVQLQQYYASHSQDYLNTWQRALNGAYIGYREGSYGGLWGILGGAVFGAIDGAADGPAYRLNANNSGYYIYGQPWATTAIQLGTTLAASYGSSAVGGAYGQAAGTATGVAINTVGNAWANSYRNGG